MDNHVSINTASDGSASPTIRLLALNQIEPSGTEVQQRRRAHYDASALKELAENIKVMQVIEPIVVRPKPASDDGTFEIVAGERRWRASSQAGLDTIPAIVRALNDQQVLEIQLVENLHREGLHELEEAEGYEMLMQQHHFGIEDLVARLGRSRAYIYARLKLLALGKKSREAFYQGKLTAATALLLARIPVAALQQEALKAITEAYGGEPLSFRSAQRHIQDRYMTRLKEAPFDTKCADLIAGAGACGSCPKLTGNQPELFGDIKGGDICTDPVCYAAKRTAWGARIRAQAKADGREVLSGKDAKRIAPYGIHSNLQGGFVSLDQRCYEDTKGRTFRQLLGKDFRAKTLLQDDESGQVIDIIPLTELTEVLKAKGIRAEKPSRVNETERARQQAAKFETTLRTRVLNAVREKTPLLIAGAHLKLLASALWHAAGHDSRIRLVNLWNWADKKKAADVVHACDAKVEKLTEMELRRFVLDCALIDEVRVSTYATGKANRLWEAAKRQGVNVEAIRKTLKAEQVAKQQKLGKGATQAPTKAKRAAKKATT